MSVEEEDSNMELGEKVNSNLPVQNSIINVSTSNYTSNIATSNPTSNLQNNISGKMFTLKKWNAVAMWSWDVVSDICAICRVIVMDACLRCQAENKSDECVVVWGECNHSFHNCCMALWVQQNNRCPLCQQEWIVQRIGK